MEKSNIVDLSDEENNDDETTDEVNGEQNTL